MSEQTLIPDSDLTAVMLPKQVITSYSDSSDFYLEIHDLFSRDGKITAGASRPLTREDIKSIMSVINEKEYSIPATVKNLLPTNILYLDQRAGVNRIVWYRPPGVATMKIEGVKKSGNVAVPGLVYVLEGADLSIFSFVSPGRPNEKTKLFHAPFFNIYDHAGVCMGNVKEPKDVLDIKELIAAWESAFWFSKFTKEVHSGGYKNLFAFWKRRLAMKRPGKFPTKMLMPFKPIKRLKDLCK